MQVVVVGMKIVKRTVVSVRKRKRKQQSSKCILSSFIIMNNKGRLPASGMDNKCP